MKIEIETRQYPDGWRFEVKKQDKEGFFKTYDNNGCDALKEEQLPDLIVSRLQEILNIEHGLQKKNGNPTKKDTAEAFQ